MPKYKRVPGWPHYRVGDDGSLWSICSQGTNNQNSKMTPELNQKIKRRLKEGTTTKKQLAKEFNVCKVLIFRVQNGYYNNRPKQWRRLKGMKSGDGHIYARLTDAKTGTVSPSAGIHRLVLMAFVGPCPNGMECCHYNDIADDNRLDNLRWDTRKNNHVDMIRHGTVSRKITNGKLSDKQVRQIRKCIPPRGRKRVSAANKDRDQKRTQLIHHLAIQFRVCPTTIAKVANRVYYNSVK